MKTIRKRKRRRTAFKGIVYLPPVRDELLLTGLPPQPNNETGVLPGTPERPQVLDSPGELLLFKKSRYEQTT